MTELRGKAAIIMAGYRLTFWQFLGSMLFGYIVAFAAAFLGPPGMFASALIATANTAFLIGGLVLFSLQRPGIALVVISIAAAIHISLLRAHVPAGLCWLLCSKPGLQWIDDHGWL